MKDSQYLRNEQALPLGYELQGYTITQYIGEDDSSISYLALSEGVEFLLMEYFPSSIALRAEHNHDVLLKETASQDEYAHGLAMCRDDLQDLVDFHHDHVLDTQRFFEANNTVYRVSEALLDQEWMSLEHCLKGKVLSEDGIMSLWTSVLDATEAIHDIGHIHSDLTPSRVLLNKHSGKLKVIGFGDMKYLFRPAAQSLSRHVSPGYSPYENYYSNETQGVWTDIYALGGILYRILTGKAPVSSASRLSTLADHQHDPLVTASSYFEGKDTYSEQLLSAVDHALGLQKQDRPQSIAEWREDLGFVVQLPEEKVDVPKLMIEGVSNVPHTLSTQSQVDDLDFAAFAHQAPEEIHAKSRTYIPVAIFGGLVSAMLVAMFVYFSPSEKEVVIDESYVPEVYVATEAIFEEERVVEKPLYSESDYLPILDVPLVDNEQADYTEIRLPYSELISDSISAVGFSSVVALTQPINVRNLVDTLEIDVSKIVIVKKEELFPKQVSHQRAPHSVKASMATVKHRPRKTREQYQKEWQIKQIQMKKRAEWEKKKLLLKQKQKLPKETQWLDENDCDPTLLGSC